MSNIAELARSWARYPIDWEPRVSKDGKWLAWTWTGATEIGNVWLVPTDGSAPPRRLTDEANHAFVRSFSPDGKQLLLAQSRGSSERDRLFLQDIASGAQRELTPMQDDFYVFSGVFFPDGKSILYTASFDDESGQVLEGQRIYRHDLGTGKRTVVSRADSLDERVLELSEDARLVLYHRHEKHPSGSQVWLLDLATGEDRELINVGDDLKAYGFWLAKDRVLVWAEGVTHDRVGVLALGGAIRWIIDDPKRSVDAVVPGQDGKTVALVDFAAGAIRATLLDLESGAETPFRASTGSLRPIEQLPDGSWIAEHYSSRGPHDYVRVDPKSGALINLSRTGDHQPKGLNFTPAKLHRWRAADGLEIEGWLYEPQGESRGLLAHVHGGPTWHSEDWVNSYIQFLVAAGFTVLDPNYRGSTGYGRAFREAIKEDGWGGREQTDIRAGLESLIAAGKGRRGRVGVVGLSYGGYASWCAITKAADLVQAAVPICGMYQLTTDYDATGMPHGRAYSEEMMGGRPDQQPERYHNASPANFINQIRGDLMIVHGLRDSNVSPANTRAAQADLDRAGIPYELLTFDDEGHGIYRAGNREELFRRSAEFLLKSFDQSNRA
jgi:dipeptidyl aminopeptidase/acylaminoacyl peptidase